MRQESKTSKMTIDVSNYFKLELEVQRDHQRRLCLLELYLSDIGGYTVRNETSKGPAGATEFKHCSRIRKHEVT
jgi:hypothetical protein